MTIDALYDIIKSIMSQRRKTVNKLRDSLIKLLETTPLEDITVTAICDMANVNRATFYYHYDSVANLFEEVERGLESEFNQFISLSAIGSDGAPNRSFYVMFFEFVAHNAAICKMILNSPHKGNNSFITRAIDGGRDKVISTMTKLFPDCASGKIDHYYTFVSNGFIGLVGYWLNNGMKESVAEIADIGERISYGGIKYLQM